MNMYSSMTACEPIRGTRSTNSMFPSKYSLFLLSSIAFVNIYDVIEQKNEIDVMQTQVVAIMTSLFTMHFASSITMLKYFMVASNYFHQPLSLGSLGTTNSINPISINRPLSFISPQLQIHHRTPAATLVKLPRGGNIELNFYEKFYEKKKPKLTFFKKKKRRSPQRNYTLIETEPDDYNNKSTDSKTQMKRRRKLYLTCIFIVMIWVSTGTIFYSKFNKWPLPQSFFYAVDAGMSIGFCTDVRETKVASRAFTIIFILMGASSVGGALAFFIKDIMEGVVEVRNCEFEHIIAKDAFDRVDKDCDGEITYAEFRELIQNWTGKTFTDEEFYKLYNKFDHHGRHLIDTKDFLKAMSNLDALLEFQGPLYSSNWLIRKVNELKMVTSTQFVGRHRIYVACLAWVSMGIIWGIKRMNWDFITATHFAISALATGGLTAPPVNADGILPTEPAIFCGIFCLIGIPLFASTLAHFARTLVENQVVAEEKRTIFRSLNKKEFDFAKSLCSPQDQMVHLSDFIVLQLIRMGKVNMDTIDLIKTQFKILDKDGSGQLLHSTKLMKHNTTSYQGM